jgi:hypothetical protein
VKIALILHNVRVGEHRTSMRVVAQLFRDWHPFLVDSVRIFVSPLSYPLTIRCWATIRDTVGWLTL